MEGRENDFPFLGVLLNLLLIVTYNVDRDVLLFEGVSEIFIHELAFTGIHKHKDILWLAPVVIEEVFQYWQYLGVGSSIIVDYIINGQAILLSSDPIVLQHDFVNEPGYLFGDSETLLYSQKGHLSAPNFIGESQKSNIRALELVNALELVSQYQQLGLHS